MKKIILLFFILISISGYSQCHITELYYKPYSYGNCDGRIVLLKIGCPSICHYDSIGFATFSFSGDTIFIDSICNPQTLGFSCDSFNSISILYITGISEVSFRKISLRIYPNPLTSSSILQLNTQLTNAEVVIYNIVGKELMRKKLTGDRMEIEKGSLESGVYFVKVRSEERQWVEKLVVE